MGAIDELLLIWGFWSRTAGPTAAATRLGPCARLAMVRLVPGCSENRLILRSYFGCDMILNGLMLLPADILNSCVSSCVVVAVWNNSVIVCNLHSSPNHIYYVPSVFPCLSWPEFVWLPKLVRCGGGGSGAATCSFFVATDSQFSLLAPSVDCSFFGTPFISLRYFNI